MVKWLICLLGLLLSPLVCSAESLLFSCQSCHGEQLQGSEAIHAPALAGQPEVYVSGQLSAYRDGIRGVHISDRYGRQMALMSSNLSDEQIVHLANKISRMPAFQLAAPITDPVYRPCATCHGLQGEGNEELRAPYLAGLDAEYLEVQMKHFRDGIRGFDEKDQYGRLMAQSMPDSISDEDIRALALLLASEDGFQ